MSYVAENYAYIADQLVTAVTGGMTREAHVFLPGLNASGFSFVTNPDELLNDTLVVAGQWENSFKIFQQNRDFELTALGKITFFSGEDSLEPADGSCWPDEGSEFFVSYYTKESHKALLTDKNVGSLNRTLSEAYARELAVLRKQMERVYRSGFVDTAEGDSLDKVVALLGLERKDRSFATGTARFFRDSAAPADITIPEGVRVSTSLNPPVSFVTTSGKTLRRGQLAVEIGVMAETKGLPGVIKKGDINVINQSILGISGVVNDMATNFGSEKESDKALRNRAKQVMERVGRATPRAMTLALTQLAGIQENDVKIVEELAARPGVVKVYVAGSNLENTTLRANIQEAILGSRPAGIRVEHNLETAVADTQSVAAAVSDDEMVDSEWEAVESPPGDDFLMPILCDVLVFPENARLDAVEKNRIKGKVESAIIDYAGELAIGGTLIFSQLIRQIMNVEGILDINLSLTFKSDPSKLYKRNMKVPEGRRLELVASDLRVHFSGDTYFDFYLEVTNAEKEKEKEIKKFVTDVLAGYFSEEHDAVSSSELQQRLSVSGLFTIALSGVSWDVEFDSSGLIIRQQGKEGAPTDIPVGDRPLIRGISIKGIV